jgi:hemerythrin
MAFSWRPSYEVGVPEIDAQHRELFACCDRLVEALSGGQGRAEIGETLHVLGRYVASHFADEELLLEQVRYRASRSTAPGTPGSSPTCSACAGVRAPRPERRLAIELTHLVRAWILRHVLVDDHAASQWLQRASRLNAA